MPDLEIGLRVALNEYAYSVFSCSCCIRSFYVLADNELYGMCVSIASA